jgi:hypothetical protein
MKFIGSLLAAIGIGTLKGFGVILVSLLLIVVGASVVGAGIVLGWQFLVVGGVVITVIGLLSLLRFEVY